jgi:hypothetical protein
MCIARVKFFRPQHDPGDWRPRPGYHPQVDAGGVYTSCVIERLDDETMFDFEREYTVRLRLLFPEEYRDAFSVGSPVHLYEGSRPVGSGIILDIL